MKNDTVYKIGLLVSFLCLLTTAIVFFVAISLAFTPTATAAEKPMWRPNPNAPRVSVPLSRSVCDIVTEISIGIKYSFDAGMTNSRIRGDLLNRARNLNYDIDNWIAINMLASDWTLNDMRSWAGKPAFQDVRKRLPHLTPAAVYGAISGGNCDALYKQGKPVEVMQLKRVDI